MIVINKAMERYCNKPEKSSMKTLMVKGASSLREEAFPFVRPLSGRPQCRGLHRALEGC